MVTACSTEETSASVAGVGNLASKRTRLTSVPRLSSTRAAMMPKIYQCVVSQHQRPLRPEVDAPAQVEDEVAQGETQNVHLERCIG